jgi:hypothetical protein
VALRAATANSAYKLEIELWPDQNREAQVDLPMDIPAIVAFGMHKAYIST